MLVPSGLELSQMAATLSPEALYAPGRALPSAILGGGGGVGALGRSLRCAGVCRIWATLGNAAEAPYLPMATLPLRLRAKCGLLSRTCGCPLLAATEQGPQPLSSPSYKPLCGFVPLPSLYHKSLRPVWGPHWHGHPSPGQPISQTGGTFIPYPRGRKTALILPRPTYCGIESTFQVSGI